MATATSPSPLSPIESVRPARIRSVDLLRGIVMVVMALDHVRDYLTNIPFPPEDMQHTFPALFYTRWVTHFCAPSFFFLAGTGAYLSGMRKTPAQLSNFLWKRGLWLIVLEMTVVFWGWTFMFPLPSVGLLVIWALGWSMICLAGLVRLPLKAVAGIGLGMIALHNLLDPIKPAQFGNFGWAWMMLHKLGFWQFHFKGGPPGLFILYPLVPWIGVMAAGYCFGAFFRMEAGERRRWFLRIGTAAILLFVLLRGFNLYGNPKPENATLSTPFALQDKLSMTVISFLNVEKYPPSLQFLLMTLGPGILFLAWAERFNVSTHASSKVREAVAGFFLVYGKVPMFYYILHIYLAHIIAIVAGLAFHEQAQWLYRGGFMVSQAPPGWGFNLPFIWLSWMACVLILYYPCKWYAGYKATHKQWWLSYI